MAFQGLDLPQERRSKRFSLRNQMSRGSTQSLLDVEDFLRGGGDGAQVDQLIELEHPTRAALIRQANNPKAQHRYDPRDHQVRRGLQRMGTEIDFSKSLGAENGTLTLENFVADEDWIVSFDPEQHPGVSLQEYANAPQRIEIPSWKKRWLVHQKIKGDLETKKVEHERRMEEHRNRMRGLHLDLRDRQLQTVGVVDVEEPGAVMDEFRQLAIVDRNRRKVESVDSLDSLSTRDAFLQDLDGENGANDSGSEIAPFTARTERTDILDSRLERIQARIFANQQPKPVRHTNRSQSSISSIEFPQVEMIDGSTPRDRRISPKPRPNASGPNTITTYARGPVMPVWNADTASWTLQPLTEQHYVPAPRR